MNVRNELLRIVEEAHSLTAILAQATRVIALRLDADRCMALVFDEHGALVHDAAFRAGAPGAAPAADEAAERIGARVVAERRVAQTCGATGWLLAAPMLLRDSVLGAVVLERSRTKFSAEEVEALTTICAQLVGIVENANIIDALDRGERPMPHVPAEPVEEGAGGGERRLRGVGASPGIAIGTAVFRGGYRLDRAARIAGDPEGERARVRTAMQKTRNDLLRIQVAAAREIDEEHALIFASHLLLLNDAMLLDRIDGEIARGRSAPVAIDTVLEDFEARLRLVPDTYIQEKTDDVGDLRSRLLGHMLDAGDREWTGRRVVLSSRIPPSLVIELKAEGAQALVAEVGGTTSHSVLLARAMGIPTVIGVTDMMSAIHAGDRVIVDGTSGMVMVRPTYETVARYEEEHQRAEHVRTDYAKFRDVLACTADGVRVGLHANVGVASDLVVARDNGAEGIGLYRTEFPFIVRDAFPTLDEQVYIYRKAYELFPVGRIQFRILDLGGDKFVMHGALAIARSAFHGYRSIRVLFDHPEVLRDQVQALAIAAGDRPLRLLIPMVSSLEELRHAKAIIADALGRLEIVHAQRMPEIGAMIEVPAAVEIAGDIAKEVDFLSIGTNDLMQYALVVDREDPRLAPLSDPYHPAILRMIARVVAAARGAGKFVTVCGEIAVRPDIALALLALGVESLSVVPTAIPELKQMLAGARLAPMRRAMAEILTLPDAASVAAALREASAA